GGCGSRTPTGDAHGQPPNIPFWLGEAPGRSDALSAAVARLREEVEQRLDGPPGGAGDGAVKSAALAAEAAGGSSTVVKASLDHPANETDCLAPAIAWLTDELGLPPAAAEQIVDYLARADRKSVGQGKGGEAAG